MKKSKIEYCDYEWTPIRTVRGSQTLSDYELNQPTKKKTPARILVSPGVDIYGVGTFPRWRKAILEVIEKASHHTFILTTKFPWHVHDIYLVNLWLGITITGKFNIDDNERKFRLFQDKIGAFMKFLNIDPMKTACSWSLSGFDWVIVGTPKKSVTRSAIHEWFDRCAVMGIPIFMRNNVKPTWGKDLIQQLPFAPEATPFDDVLKAMSSPDEEGGESGNS